MNNRSFRKPHASGMKITALLYMAPFLLMLNMAPAYSADAQKILQVGWGKEFLLPSIAAKFARDGDIIEIDAGVYEKDAATWKQNNLVIRAIGGRAHLKAAGAHAEGKAIWVIKGNDITIENIEFSGAKVPDGNGAGIRIEGTNLTIRNCYFHDNENGILGGSNPNSDILIEFSEFARNGGGTGQTHNIYIGAVRSFTLRHSYSHHARVGHNVKSRALQNDILYNRIMDEELGTSSYAIDLPNGGLSFIIGNEIQQGQNTENSTIVSYGAEGLKNPDNALYFVNNTVVNDRERGGRFLFTKPGTTEVRILNNIFVGKAQIESGSPQMANNIFDASGNGLMDRGRFNYHLRKGAKAIDAGAEPGMARNFPLTPEFEYQHPLKHTPRTRQGMMDAGAHEFSGQ